MMNDDDNSNDDFDDDDDYVPFSPSPPVCWSPVQCTNVILILLICSQEGLNIIAISEVLKVWLNEDDGVVVMIRTMKLFIRLHCPECP